MNDNDEETMRRFFLRFLVLSGGYHGKMNAELFQKWLQERLLPNIPDNSVIVKDNAAYHSQLSVSSAPTSGCSKTRIQN